MVRVAIIGGTGKLGLSLAKRWALAGEHVIIGSRSKDKALRASRCVKESVRGCKVEGRLNKEAVVGADIVVISVPFVGLVEIVKEVRGRLSEGQLVVSCVNPIEKGLMWEPYRPVTPWHGSVAEMVAYNLPKHVKVYAAFNNLSSSALSDLGKPVECDVIVFGEDGEGKLRVMELAEKIEGVRALDGGPLDNARFLEHLSAFLLYLNLKYGSDRAGFRITGINFK